MDTASGQAIRAFQGGQFGAGTKQSVRDKASRRFSRELAGTPAARIAALAQAKWASPAYPGAWTGAGVADPNQSLARGRCTPPGRPR